MESSCRISHYLRCCDSRFHSKLQFHHSPTFTRDKKPLPHLSISASNFSPPDSLRCFQGKEQELTCDGLSPLTGGIIALGKFDALHIGHRELAVQASKHGIPFLLSLVGIAEVLGWEQRAPIVAKCDRKRVLSSWAPYCSNVVPIEFHLEFSKVRHLTPQQFVEKLSKELKVSGVVAGENYRFGYKASGDASDLVKLCKQYGLEACIVTSVMDKKQLLYDRVNKRDNPRERGQVSSTRVCHALAEGDMMYVSELLGRKHRLVLAVGGVCVVQENKISALKSCMLNQQPRDGLYENCILLIDEVFLGPCRTIIDETHIHVELTRDTQVQMPLSGCQFISIEFGCGGNLS